MKKLGLILINNFLRIFSIKIEKIEKQIEKVENEKIKLEQIIKKVTRFKTGKNGLEKSWEITSYPIRN